MKVTFTVFLALIGATGVVCGPLQKRAEVTVTTTQTILTTVTVDGPAEVPTAATTTTEAPAVTTSQAATDASSQSSDSAVASVNIDSNTLGNVNNNVETPAVSSAATSAPEPATTSAASSAESSTPAQTATPSDSSSTDPLIAAALKHHNVHRANHSSPDVTWADDIAGYAAITAATCNFAHDVTTGGGGYGQNIAMWASSGDVQATGKDVFMGRTITEMWYNGEINLFPANQYGQDQPDMTNFHEWGHYTQVIWAETTTVGCAVQYCEPGTMADGMGAYFSVCNYSPPGNMGGEYAVNVLPPEGESTFNAS